MTASVSVYASIGLNEVLNAGMYADANVTVNAGINVV